MKSSKKSFEKIAKLLYKRSLTGSEIDEKKVRTVLKHLIMTKPFGITAILKSYKRLVASKISREEIVVETQDKLQLPKNQIENLKKQTGAKRVINKKNPNLVLGAMIYHGDWIVDGTLDGKLNQLKETAWES